MSRELTHGSLFSGIEGFGLGAALAGIKTEWSCEFEKYQTEVIKKNFGDGHTVYGDIRTLENPPFVNIISGGFPCQDISVAGKGTGIKGSRSGLWGEMLRAITNVRPDYVVIENSPLLRKRGFEYVLHGLSEIGYDAQWQCLQGGFLGLQQRRERMYIIAYPNSKFSERESPKPIFRKPYLPWELPRIYPGWRERRDLPEPRTFRSVNDIPNLVDRNKCLGNAVQPLMAQYLFECIKVYDAENV